MAKIELSYNNREEVIEVPVLPKMLEVKQSGKNSYHTLQEIGEITVINPSAPKEVTLSSFFPLHDAPYVTSETLKEPKKYVATIEKWWRTGKPIRLKTEGLAFPLNIPCSITGFTYKEVAGAPGDIGYTLSLKEFKWFKAETATHFFDKDMVRTEERQDEKVPPKTYTVQQGDTLYAICRRLLGDGNLYKEVAKKNGIKNPNLIRVGQVLIL